MKRSLILAAALAFVGTVASADAIDNTLQSLADKGATDVQVERGTDTTKIEGTLNGEHFEMSVRNSDGTVVHEESGSDGESASEGTDGAGQDKGDGESGGEHDGSDGGSDGSHDGGSDGGHDGSGDGGHDSGGDGADK